MPVDVFEYAGVRYAPDLKLPETWELGAIFSRGGGVSETICTGKFDIGFLAGSLEDIRLLLLPFCASFIGCSGIFGR